MTGNRSQFNLDMIQRHPKSSPKYWLLKPMQKPIRKVSKTRQKQNSAYTRLKKAWKKYLEQIDKWRCVRCGGVPADEPHHKNGRISVLLNMKELWLCCCRKCHDYIHRHPAEARERGWLAKEGDWNRVPTRQ